MINDWNPVVFAELHGFMTQFLVEPLHASSRAQYGV